MSSSRTTWSWVRKVFLYPARHIRWKIIAPYAVLTLLLAVAGTFVATRLVTGSLEDRFNNQLAEAARVTSDSVVRRERQHLEMVRSVAFTDGVATALEARSTDYLALLVEPLAANNKAELVEVLDARGQSVLGMRLADPASLRYEALSETGGRTSWSIVQSVLNRESDALGDKFAQIVQTADGYALYTAGPIFQQNRLVGVVLIGSLLDSFLPVAKGEALADITIYDFEGTPVATTFATAGSDNEADLTPDEAVLAGFGAPTALRESKTLFGRGFDLVYGELVVRDQVVGVYSVALPSSFILSAGGSTRWQMGFLFSAATAAVLFTGWLVARSLTRPLLRLVSTARAVSAGDLTARSAIRTGDEVGVLAGTFDGMTERLQRQHLATIRALTSAIDARDPYTAGHSARVGQLAVELGAALGLPESQLQHLEIGGYLHDTGKIGVRDAVLLKPGPLTEEEREIVEGHPGVGLDILAAVDLAPDVVAFISGHHEKLDGSGYPRSLKSGEVSLIARIAAVADIYDSLTTDRPYRGAMSVEEALDILDREAVAGRLDRHVVATLVQLVPQWERRRRTDPTLKGFRLPDYPTDKAA
jgi:HD-GYP domain-containing protein (c-di-GMP phosphodiesterase class II)